MKVSDAIQRSYTHATGHVDTLATTDPKYLRFLAIADSKQKEWQDEPGIDWPSLYTQANIGTVLLNTADYPIDLTVVRKVSAREGDSVVVQTTPGNTWFYDVITPDKLTQFRFRNASAVLGTNLHFANSPENPIFPANDARLGATITLPYYIFVDDIVRDSQIIQVDDPMWLVYMMAAEYVRNDLVRQNQYPNLVALASLKMEGMRQRAEDQLYEVPVDLDLYDLEPNTGLSSGAWY